MNELGVISVLPAVDCDQHTLSMENQKCLILGRVKLTGAQSGATRGALFFFLVFLGKRFTKEITDSKVARYKNLQYSIL